MRCKRCHTKLTPGKKTCPVCGTLVVKRRGSVRLATSAGGSPLGAFGDALSRIDGRKVLATLAAAAAIVCAVLMIAGCGSCESCGNSENESGCTTRLNDGKTSTEFYADGSLYYVNGEKLVAFDGSTSVVAHNAKAMSNICVAGDNIYYLQYGNVWTVPRDAPITADDTGSESSAVMLLNATDSGSDIGVTRVTGFTVEDRLLCYWGTDSQGSYSIMTRNLDNGQTTLLHSGQLTNVQVYRDSIYYVSRNDADSGLLYRVSFVTGEKAAVTDSAINFYALSSGYAFVCRYVEGENTLFQISLSSGAAKKSWIIGEIDGVLANDNWIYYYTNSDMTGGDIYRIKPGESKATRIFHDSNDIMLAGIAGDYFAVYTKIGATPEDRLTNAKYYIFNAETRERVL